MEEQLERYWQLAVARYSPLASAHSSLISHHDATIYPYDSQVPGLTQRLYYIPNCKVLEVYETNRVLGEKLGLNTREKCWFYERWKEDRETKVLTKSWKKEKDWGEIVTTDTRGRRVTYWKEEGGVRKVGEYSQQGSTESIKKVQSGVNPAGVWTHRTEVTVKSPSLETGETLQLEANRLCHTKWQLTKKEYQGECLDLHFSDLEDVKEAAAPAKEEATEADYKEIAERCKETMIELAGETLSLLRRKGWEWSGIEATEDCLQRLKASGVADVPELLSELSQKQQALLSRFLSDSAHFPISSRLHVPSSDALNESDFGDPSKRLSFGHALDSSDPAFAEVTQVGTTDQEETLPKAELIPDSEPEIAVKRGMNKIPQRQKVRKGLNRAEEVNKKLKYKILARIMEIWKEKVQQPSPRKSVGLLASPKSNLWTARDVDFQRGFREAAARKQSQVQAPPEFSSLFEGILQQEIAYIRERSHLQHCYKTKGDHSQSPIGDAVFSIFEELMDKKYQEIQEKQGKEVPLSLSQFFCEQLVPRRGFSRPQLKRFSQFMRTLLTLYDESHPYGTFICRLLRISHPQPIFDTAGRLITQLRYEVLPASDPSRCLQYYAEIPVLAAIQSALILFQSHKFALVSWTQAIPVADLSVIQRTVFWISTFLAVSDSAHNFATLFSGPTVDAAMFARLGDHWPLTPPALTAVYDHYKEGLEEFTVDAWERLVTDGDFLRLKYGKVPLWVLFNAVLEAFHEIQKRLAVEVLGRFGGQQALTKLELEPILAEVIPGLNEHAINEICQTAEGVSGSRVLSYESVMQAIIRLKVEIR